MDPLAALILGSGSPRRRELLEAAGLRFQVEPADVDESLEPPEPGLAPWGERAEEAAKLLAERKALAVAERHPGERVIVLGADTMVAVGGQLLGKPDGPVEARAMLEQLSGQRHRVVTGVCAIRCRDGLLRSAWERTWVTMETLTPARIAAYLAQGEWSDKAGAYGIQGAAGAFVTGIEEGGNDNVVGLPVSLTLGLLDELGWSGVPGSSDGSA